MAPWAPLRAGAPPTPRLAGTWKGEARVRAEPFAEVELELAALWTA
jgi:hypothetical protein